MKGKQAEAKAHEGEPEVDAEIRLLRQILARGDISPESRSTDQSRLERLLEKQRQMEWRG